MTDATAQAAMIGALAREMAFSVRACNDTTENPGDHWGHKSKNNKDLFLLQAAAVLALVGPKQLVWDHPDQKLMYSKGGSLLLTMFTSPQEGVRMWRLGLRGETEYQWFDEDRLAEAQATAQDHYDAAHWSNTGLGYLIKEPK
jgi:hypothetical protein